VNAVLHRFDLRDLVGQDIRAAAGRFQPHVIVVIRPVKLEPERLAPEGCDRQATTRLVIFGAGAQAAAHLRAMVEVRPIQTVTIINRNATRAQHLIEIGQTLGVEVCRGDADALAHADIVCTCTTSPTPVVDGSVLSPGTHVNAIGSYHPDVRELDDVSARRGRWFVEERTRVFDESGDVLMPIASGAVGTDFVVDDLFGLCSGGVGRTSAEEITVFKSVGLAIEDLAIADALIRAQPD
jgi:ornithine cyclodeaminase/alanine dehydrogenase-like protein (mu-crystallin family)